MSLASGARLGPYEILSALGAGGMGEVYRARDTKLNRDVAIKVLPEVVATDPERLARFHREAQVLASLNHPNIAHIHGYEESNGVHALVMELVEGPTLADRIAQGPIPLNEALPIARQIAEALETAHEQGIIHRDLKPANIKVRDDGTVKVLDFGLAKALEPGGVTAGAASQSMSPTITTPAMTQAGMILGTAAYMSPEQARGKAVDKRADIWAFGTVLFEMITGQRAFPGEDLTDTLAAVVKLDPKWDALAADAPARVRQVLRACLQKDPRQRMGDMQSVRLALEGTFETLVTEAVAVAPAPAGVSRAAWIAGASGLIAAVALVGAFGVTSRDVPAPPRVSFEVRADVAGGGASYQFALSPDGGSLVARVSTPGGPDRLWVRRLDRLGGTFLEGTENAGWPCWSPDGRSVAFSRDGKIVVTEAAGGSPQALADAPVMRGCSWNAQRTILFASTGGVFRVDAVGGSRTRVTDLDAARADVSHRFPVFLPDGDHFLFHVEAASPEQSGIYAGSLGSKDVKRIGPSSIGPRFAPPDLLLFGRDTALMAQRFDTARLELVGTPVRVTGDLDVQPEQMQGGVTVSNTGAIAYRPGSSRARNLQWRDRAGNVTGTVGAPGAYRNPRLSPDGTRLAVAREDGDKDIWITDLTRDTPTRLTFDPASDDVPVWSPDGSRVAFSSSRAGGVYNLYQRNANGTGTDELLLQNSHHKIVNDWSADGRYLIYQEQDPTTKSDIWALPLFGDRKPFRLVGTPAVDRAAALSPDGRWLAYVSDDDGANRVYVQGFPVTGGRWQVSTSLNAGVPLWRSATELFYDASSPLMAVEVTAATAAGEFKAGPQRQLFTGLLAIWPHNMDVTRDGRRFLVLGREPDPDGVAPIVVTLNWRPELEQ